MSVVVAIKEKDRVYMGCDSQVTKGGSRFTLHNKNNFKIWKVNGSNNTLMGSVGNLRDANVIRLLDGLVSEYNEYKKQVDFRFVVSNVLPIIIGALKEAKYLKMSGEYFDYMDSTYIFVYKNQLYEINCDGSVIEIDDYVAIGSGQSEAIGSLLSTEGLDPKERIIRAIKASAANDIYVDYPIVVTDSKSCEFDVITEKDEKEYLSK